MLNFIKNIFRGAISFLLWAVLIIGAIAGFSIADIPGAIIGILSGIIINVIFGGLISTFISIDKHLEELNEQLRKIRKANSNEE